LYTLMHVYAVLLHVVIGSRAKRLPSKDLGNNWTRICRISYMDFREHTFWALR
jgi:hypothetical protein